MTKGARRMKVRLYRRACDEITVGREAERTKILARMTLELLYD